MQAIACLSLDKLCGMDGVYAENIKCSDNSIVPLLATCLNRMLIDGYLSTCLYDFYTAWFSF